MFDLVRDLTYSHTWRRVVFLIIELARPTSVNIRPIRPNLIRLAMGLWATSNGKSLITAATLILLPLFLSFVITRLRPQIQDQNIVTEVSGVKIERNPSQSKLDQLGVTAWRTYATSLSSFLCLLSFCISK